MGRRDTVWRGVLKEVGRRRVRNSTTGTDGVGLLYHTDEERSLFDEG